MTWTGIPIRARSMDDVRSLAMGTADVDDLDMVISAVNQWGTHPEGGACGQFIIDVDRGIAGFEILIVEDA